MLLLRLRAGARPSAAGAVGTWDCGYGGPASARIQYTGSSLGQVLVGLLSWAVRVDEARPRPVEPFPGPLSYESRPTEPLLDRWLNPFCRRWADRFMRLRILQRGNVQIYLVYVLVTLVLCIAWAMLSPQVGP
jgi:hydrogenase-4 component B